jgi:hypothetical protein
MPTHSALVRQLQFIDPIIPGNLLQTCAEGLVASYPRAGRQRWDAGQNLGDNTGACVG